MHHATPLITTIVGGLVLAFILGMIANKLRISPLVGYLLAGVLAGPFTPGFVADTKLAPELAELGVILLMFGVGLHFSLKDLMAVKSIAIPGAIAQIGVATLLGMALSAVLGWSIMTGIVFGLCLSTASTVVLLRALEERQLIDSQRGQIAIGWLIVEDLVMVLTLVLLPAVAGMMEKENIGFASLALDMSITIGKVVAFIAIMMLVGRRLVPWIMKNLVIQTAKIGDFINATPLLAYLQKSDVLVSRSVGALAKHDETIEQIYFIEQHKRNLWRKLCFACRIMNRYDNVYLLQPNSVNLFFSAVCNAKNKQFLTIYTRRWYHGIFYVAADGTVEHGKKTLSVTNYLKLADRALTWQDSPKHATKPLFEPTTWPAILDKPDVIRIGISIAAGNKAKTVPPVIWKRIVDQLADLPCEFYVFGAPNEQSWMDDITRLYGEIPNFINLIGKISLEELPWAISKMDCYIASDSGNVYIADAVGVPVVLLFGPCCHYEQRPLGNVLLIGNDDNICSYVFETRYYFPQEREALFSVTDSALHDLQQFIRTLPKARSLASATDAQGN